MAPISGLSVQTGGLTGGLSNLAVLSHKGAAAWRGETLGAGGADFSRDAATDTKQTRLVFIKGFEERNPSRIGF